MTDEKIWTPLELVKVTTEYLATKQVPNPRLDAEVLLLEVMGLERRVDLYAGFERKISGKELTAYRELIRRRSGREPVSRILGRREFMGIRFKITPDVFSPRPETELLVESALEALRPKPVPPPASDDEEALRAAAAAAASENGDGVAAADPSLTAILDKILDSYAEDAESADEEEEREKEQEREKGHEQAAAKPAAAPSPRQAGRFTANPATAAAATGAAAAAASSSAAAAAAKQRPAPGRKPARPAAPERRVRVLDLGTGSGCIAVSLAAHLPGATVVAIDASPKALAVAKRNAAEAGVAERVDFRQGDWFAGCRDGEMFDVVLSNPPYLVEGDPEIWPEAARFDPPLALYGGRDGLDPYRRIVHEALERLASGGLIFFEVGAGQAGRVADLLRGRGFREVTILADYGGMERVVRAAAE